MMHGCYGRRLPAGSSDAALTGGAGGRHGTAIAT
jgi:hypothetical protein